MSEQLQENNKSNTKQNEINELKDLDLSSSNKIKHGISFPKTNEQQYLTTENTKTEGNLKETSQQTEKPTNQGETQQPKPYNIYMQTPFLLRLLMIDMLKLIMKASRDTKIYKVITTLHLPQLLPQHTIEHTHSVFLQNINSKIELAKRKKRELNASDMLNVFMYTFRWEIFVSIFFNSMGYAMMFIYSILISVLITYIADNGVDANAYGIAAAFNLCVILSVIFGHNILRVNAMISSIFRNIFMKVLYTKISSLSAFSVKEANIGKLVNLISNDLSTIEYKSNVMFALLSIPLPLIAVTTYLILQYGPIGLIGLGVMLALCPIQYFFSKLNSNSYDEKSKYTDQRVNLTNEIVEGIRLIKMYAWEEVFVHSIGVIRKIELKKILISTLISVVDLGLSNSFSVFGTFVIFYVSYHYDDSSPVDTALLFTTFSMLSFVKSEVVQVIGQGTAGIFQFKIILTRLISVFALKESSMTKLDDEEGNVKIKSNIDNGCIQMNDFTAYWKENNPVLNNINLNIKRGECVCLVGKVGSGKSSFLNCILKEVPLFKGTINFSGKLAYVEQEPYIFSSTVKENILFGREFNEQFYKKVISACCLEEDIQSFKSGDNTQIGERGMNISGGQKARISLARAIYSQADIYLLDDPLSAVDSKVAKVLFFDAIKTLCKGSTVILVTHQIHFAKYTDKILVFEDGSIQKQGTYQDLEGTLKSLSSELHHIEEIHQEYNKNIVNEIEKNSDENQEEIKDSLIEKKEEKSEQIFTNEEDINVNFKTYSEFFKATGLTFFIPIVISLYASCDVVYVFYNKKLGEFDSSNEKVELLNMVGYLVLIYIVNQVIKHTSLCFAINRASKKILHKMISTLVRSKVFYFDITPSGRILNRFSMDIGMIDENLASTLVDIIEIFIGVIVMFITIMIITPYFIIVAAVELIVLVIFYQYCKEGILQTKQIDLKCRSPLLSHFSLTIQGVLPIKVYDQKDNFEQQFNSLATDSLRASFYFWISQRGFGGFIHLFATICNSIGIFIIISVTTSSSSIGQSIIYFMTGTEILQWGIRQLVSLDVAMTSVQRCLNITKIEPEAPLKTKYDNQFIDCDNQQKGRSKKQKEPIFPLKGELVFQNVKMRYRQELDLVLKNLSFKISPGKRVGFIGRTGAGKSSIIQALFRMTELESSLNQRDANNEMDLEINSSNKVSKILIDGHDIKNMGLHTLRKSISIIPQVPFIFSGTIRRNLDPLNQYSDDQINQVLEDIELHKKVYSLEKNLLEDMSNANDIFSTGQKQLICLGRAILRQSQLIVLDEATANVDMLTDELIQRKIRQRFKNSTVITIAHRLNTVADYDQIIVMDQGQAVEQGSPYELLNKKEGLFFQMVQHTGVKNAQLITSIAKQQQEQQQCS